MAASWLLVMKYTSELDREALTIGVEEVRSPYRSLSEYAFLCHAVGNALSKCETTGGCTDEDSRFIQEAIGEIRGQKIAELITRGRRGVTK